MQNHIRRTSVIQPKSSLNQPIKKGYPIAFFAKKNICNRFSKYLTFWEIYHIFAAVTKAF